MKTMILKTNRPNKNKKINFKEMKTINKFKLVIFLLTLGVVSSCVQGDDYKIPEAAIQQEPDVTVNSSIQAMMDALAQSGEATYTFESGLVVEGYVVSNDEAGNFYKSITIQDAPENPTAGIEILIDKTSLFETYNFGRKVYVMLDGLSINYDDGDDNITSDGTPGRFTLGMLSGSDVEEIPSFSYTNSILRSAETATIVPTVITMADFGQEHINTFVQLQDVQFEINELGKTFAGEANDEFDGFRNVISCSSEQIAKLQTSTFADFKSYLVPEQKGALNAVLAKDFFADIFVLILNDPSNIEFASADRCDPLLLECGAGTVGGAVELLNEDFEGLSGFSELETLGWSNTNVNGGAESYEYRSFSGNYYMQVSAFRSGETPLEVWLVTPSINLDSTTDEELTFKANAGYYNGAALSVYVSSDYTGDASTATWYLVDADLPEGPSSGYGTFMSSGSVNLSCLDGDVVVAFKYLGADNDITTTIQIDDVKITGN